MIALTENDNLLARVHPVHLAVLGQDAAYFGMAYPPGPLLGLRVPVRGWVLRDLLVRCRIRCYPRSLEVDIDLQVPLSRRHAGHDRSRPRDSKHNFSSQFSAMEAKSWSLEIMIGQVCPNNALIYLTKS